ncbi:MAG TPA: tetratricopeptide repeat protein, partial [Vicinamibacteria bacterium]|nr:tetratricopeptide repeat protein [Vicinamibacteria bacterium]
MRTVVALLATSLLLPGGAAAAEDRLSRLLTELRESGEGQYGCFKNEAGILGSRADTAASEFQRTRRLAGPGSARALLASLIEFERRPSESAFQELRRALVDAGATPEASEDVCRCVYYSGEKERSPQLASVPPAGIGLYWAARVLHEDGRAGQALDLYRRALEADAQNPRTRLLYAIALVTERRAAEALEILAAVPADWAPEPVTYWRARALVEMGEPARALPLLDPARPLWKDAPTVPEAWIGAGPVQPTIAPACLLGRVRAELGDEAGARALLADKDGKCRRELGRLELRQGRAFEALLALDDMYSDDPMQLEALAALKACQWARLDLAHWDRMCAKEGHRPTGCPRLPEVRERVLAACPAAVPPEQVAPADEGLAARLGAPRLVPFEERPVPGQWRWTGGRPKKGPSTKAYPGLSDFTVVALSRAATRMFAVSVSQDLDPRGEVSSGGYWLHLSSTRGRTWEGPYYLGFAEQFPYVVLGASRVPAFEGGRVNIEVERREIDESTISFPPVGLRAKNVEKDLYLAVDVAAVQRDADGDGLTDLVEEKLALDPGSADTDGDGLADASDPLPLQARSEAESAERAQLLAAVLPFLFRGPPPVQQTAAEGDEG